MKKKHGAAGVFSKQMFAFIFVTSLTLVFGDFSLEASASQTRKVEDVDKITEVAKDILELKSRSHSSEMKEIVGRLNEIESNFLTLYDRVKGQGYVDIKTLSNGVQFYVQRNSNVTEMADVIITFQVELLNVGKAMDLKTGIFRAPVSGTYFFAFSAIKGKNKEYVTEVYLYHNNKLVAAAFGTYGQRTTLALQSLLQLKSGDKIYLKKGQGDTILFDKLGNGEHEGTTHFTGWLLEESSEF